MEKWPFLDQNHGLTALEKCQFFNFLNFLFLQLKKAFFRSRISATTFSRPILPKKINLEKWLFLDQTHGLTHSGKCKFFNFELLVFIAQKSVFSLQNIVKDIFQAYIAQRKKSQKKYPFLDQIHGSTPLEKCEFFDFLNLLFLEPKKAFFRSTIS